MISRLYYFVFGTKSWGFSIFQSFLSTYENFKEVLNLKKGPKHLLKMLVIFKSFVSKIFVDNDFQAVLFCFWDKVLSFSNFQSFLTTQDNFKEVLNLKKCHNIYQRCLLFLKVSCQKYLLIMISRLYYFAFGTKFWAFSNFQSFLTTQDNFKEVLNLKKCHNIY